MKVIWYNNLDDATENAMNWSADSGQPVRVFSNEENTRFYVEIGPSFPQRTETIRSLWMNGKRQHLQPRYIDVAHDRWLDRE
jgi:hypothetical protein